MFSATIDFCGGRIFVKEFNLKFLAEHVYRDSGLFLRVQQSGSIDPAEESLHELVRALFLAHFGERFTTVLSTGCECCACTRSTEECRESGIQQRV
jgi:hypothetical protein